MYGILQVSKLWKFVTIVFLLDLQNFKTNFISLRWGKDLVLAVVVRGWGKIVARYAYERSTRKWTALQIWRIFITVFETAIFENVYWLIIYTEYDCYIFSKYLVFQMKNLVFQSKYPVFRSKTLNLYFESEILKY